MKLEKHTLLSMILFLGIAPFAVTQETTAQPCPEVTPGTLGCELIAWSHLQEPVPLPDPDATTQPDQQSAKSSNSETEPQAARQRITGIIVRQGEKYVLKAGDNTTYQLDDQDKAKRYQDKQVLVVGTLDAANHTIRIESIELAS
jgi:Protein of unknown function (DUF5818)